MKIKNCKLKIFMFIVVLGGGIDLTGKIPSYVYERLDEAVKIYKSKDKDNAVKIVLTGRYSFLYGKKKPPITEANKMAEYLLKIGVPRKSILRENFSRDTIGNAYYLKKYLFIPRHEKQAIIITSNFHIERVRYVFKKIFGPNYDLNFIEVAEKLSSSTRNKIAMEQKAILKRTKKWLTNMKDGDHNFLKNKLYKTRYYKNKRPDWLVSFISQGKIK